MTVEEAIKKSGTRNLFAKGSTKYAQEMLSSDEELLYAINTNFSVEGINGKLKVTEAFKIKGKLNGVVAITTKRIFFCSDNIGVKKTSKEIAIDNIQSVDDVANSLTNLATIRIKGLTEMFVFSIPGKIQQEIKNSIVKAMKSNTDTNNNSNSNYSIADEIKKYKELLDMGAITKEEFDIKKKELLNM